MDDDIDICAICSMTADYTTMMEAYGDVYLHEPIWICCSCYRKTCYHCKYADPNCKQCYENNEQIMLCTNCYRSEVCPKCTTVNGGGTCISCD